MELSSSFHSVICLPSSKFIDEVRLGYIVSPQP